ncbi:MAG: hypothetical protein ABIE94_07320 [archaeon]
MILNESKDISDFWLRYHTPTAQDFVAGYIGSSSKFAKFYYEVASAIGLPHEKCIEFAKLVAEIDKAYTAIDSIIDSDMSRSARIETVWAVQMGYALGDKLSRMGLSFDLIMKAFEEGQVFFRKESAMMNGEIEFGEADLKRMLTVGNCDFQSFTSLFLEYLPPEMRAQGNVFKEFMSGYEGTDLILDNIVDVKEDEAKGDYNMISWRRRSIDEPLADTYRYFVEMAMQIVDGTLVFGIDSQLVNRLQFYLDGQRRGLEIYKDMSFLIDHPEREEYTRFLLKPHPWEDDSD